MGSPTSLPDYEKLTEKIAEGMGIAIPEEIQYDVFLGKLKANGVPVNELAAEMLSKTCIEHNKLHEAIIDLFPNSEDIKIVTTNYDEMFEQVLIARKKACAIYNAPALPLGNDIKGIIHIHGNVKDPKYMIVTDEDFGKGYLTEGYVSRFLIKLFETYTVLFIGYSYNDTIMRYLTRAMSRQNIGKKYILTDDGKSDWSALGIQPILFPNKDFSRMRESLKKFGNCVRRGLLDWEKFFLEIKDAPPKDLTIGAEVDYCIEDIQRARIMAKIIHGKGWIEYLDRRQVFDKSFSKKIDFSEHDFLWADWLCSNFVGKEDDAILGLMLRHNNIVNQKFAEILVQKLINNSEISGRILARYIVLLNEFLTNSWTITRLVKMLFKRKENHLAFILFKKLFDCRYVLQNGWGLEKSYEFEHRFLGGYYEINDTWKLIGKALCKDDALGLISFVQMTIEEMCYKYASLNSVSRGKEPWELSMLVIEEREEERFNDEELDILAEIYLEAINSIQGRNLILRTILLQHLDSESTLLKKLSLKAVRTTKVFEPGEVLNILLERELIGEFFVKEQVFLLIAEIFSKLNEREKDSVIDAIESLDQDDDDLLGKRKVYDWCEWIQREYDKNSRLNGIISSYSTEYGFKPHKHPEYIMEPTTVTWIQDISPISEAELKQQSYAEAVKYIKNFKPDPFEGPNRYGLLKMLSSCISKDYNWTKGIVGELIIQKTKDELLWQYVFRGIEDAHFELNQTVELLEYLSLYIANCNYDKHLSSFLYEVTKLEDIKNCFDKYEKRLYSVAEIIWNNRSHKQIKFERKIDATLNTTSGLILLSLINMLYCYKELCFPSKYKRCFEQALRIRSWEKDVSVCILAGHFNFFYYRDKKWTVDNLEVYLNGKNKRYFLSAWEGMTYFSRRINKDTIDIITPIYLEALKHLELLKGETKHGFINLLLILMIYAIEKPTLEFIPALYNYATEDDIRLFISAIRNRLADMDENDKTNWWNQWLRLFIDNRKKNKPIPMYEKEKMGLLYLLTELDCVFEEAVEVICKGMLPKNIDGVFWCSFDEKQLAAKHPHSTVVAITSILDAVTSVGYDDLFIKNIVSKLKDLSTEEQRQLQEALLRKNITISETGR